MKKSPIPQYRKPPCPPPPWNKRSICNIINNIITTKKEQKLLNTAVNSCWLSQGDIRNTIHLPKKVFKIQNHNRDSYFLTKTINWTITREKKPVHSTKHIAQFIMMPTQPENVQTIFHAFVQI